MTKKMHMALFCAVAIIGLLISPVTAVDAAPGEHLYRLFDHAQDRPDIDGNMIVWEDDRDGNAEIYIGTVDGFRPYPSAYTGERLTTNAASQEMPSISGDYIVWQDDRDGDREIYLYRRSTGEETRLTNSPDDQWLPIIRGNYVAWYDSNSTSNRTNVVLYDTAQDETTIIDANATTTIPGGTTEFKPALSENYVAWVEGADQNVYYYDIAAETIAGPVSTSTSIQSWPSLSGSAIAWEDYRHGDFGGEIYMTDLDNPSGGEKRITNAPGDQVSPAISGSIIAWEDMRDGNRSIYMYDLATDEEMSVYLSPEPNDEQLYPAVSGNAIVWQRRASPNSNLYIFVYEPGAPIESVATNMTIKPEITTVAVNETVKFEATVRDQFNATMTGVDVIWTTSNETFGTIDDTGLFTGVAVGLTTVTATAGNASASALVTVEAPVEPPEVASITVKPPTTTLQIGGTQQFEATVLDQFDQELSTITVNWTSSDPAVGTINETGLFTAVAEGTTNVTATVGEITGEATVNVSAEGSGEPVVTDITIDPLTAIVAINETRQFTATVIDQDGKNMTAEVTWTSSNETIGTIDNTGLFTAVTAGLTTVTAKAGNETASATVTVSAEAPPDPVAARITLTSDRTTAVVNETVTFSATVYDLNDTELPDVTVNWTSSDPAVGTIDETGLFTAIGEGTANVTATAGNASASALVTVEALPEPILDNLRITPSGATLAIGDTQRFVVTALDGDGNTMTNVSVNWTSSDETVGTIGEDGTFTALAVGTANVTATAENITGEATVTVINNEPALASIAVTPSEITLVSNDTATFTATALDQFGNEISGIDINWTSSDETIGTIDTNGLFTAVADGTMTVTATAENITGEATVTVATASSGVVVSPSTITLGAGESRQFTVHGLQDNAGSTVNWSCDDEAIGTIDTDGLFNAVADGIATITATAENETGAATVTVESSPVATTIEIEPPTDTILPGETRAFTATVFDQRDSEMDWIRVTWSSSNPEVGTIDRAGLFGAFTEGSTEITASAGDAAGTAAITVSATVVPEPTPVNPGGGGGSVAYSDGGGSSEPTFCARTCENLAGGQTFTFSDLTTSSVGSVNVTAASTIPKMMLTVKKTNAPSAAEPPAGDVYEYVEIAISWANPNQIGGATVFFTIPARWLEDQNMTPEDVRLMRYVNGAWESLETTVVGEENGRYDFRATTPGFSTFAIAASPSSLTASAEEIDVTPVETGTPDVTETPVVTENVTTEPTETVPTTTPAAPLVYAPFLAPLAFLLWARRRH